MDPGKTVWKIGAVMFTEGERYFMLLDKAGTVSMMPASAIVAWLIVKGWSRQCP